MEFDEYVVDLNADCKCGCRDLHRFHNIYHFPNNYGASVVENPKRPGFDTGDYRALAIIFSDDVCNIFFCFIFVWKCLAKVAEKCVDIPYTRGWGG